jgi:very-short-patch-repair endonuclease
MKCIGLNGREYKLDLKKYLPKERGKRSYYHLLARELTAELFQGYTVLEEVKLPGSSQKLSVLYLDFLIPNCKIGIEVHGSQHFKYTPFFHKTKAGFLRAKKRDLDKIEWCRINEIELIALRYDDSYEHWKDQIERSR